MIWVWKKEWFVGLGLVCEGSDVREVWVCGGALGLSWVWSSFELE